MPLLCQFRSIRRKITLPEGGASVATDPDVYDEPQGMLIGVTNIGLISDPATWEKYPRARSSRKRFAYVIVDTGWTVADVLALQEPEPDPNSTPDHIWYRRCVTRVIDVEELIQRERKEETRIRNTFDWNHMTDPVDFPIVKANSMRQSVRDRIANPKSQAGRDAERIAPEDQD
jgi:hypothetical protein